MHKERVKFTKKKRKYLREKKTCGQLVGKIEINGLINIIN